MISRELGLGAARGSLLTSGTEGDALDTTITLWRAHWDPGEGEELDVSWPELLDALRRWRPFRGAWNHPGWSPVVFAPRRRSVANVRAISALVLPVGPRAGLTVDAATELFADRSGLIHTTHRHTTSAPDLLVVLPLTRPVSVSEYSAALGWAHHRAASAGAALGELRASDAARFHYLPGVVPGARWDARLLYGTSLDPDSLGAVSALRGRRTG